MATIEKMIEALTLAKGILDYCPGDAWERECTHDDRNRFNELYDELFPKKPEKALKITYTCDICGKTGLACESAVKEHKKAKHGFKCPVCGSTFLKEESMHQHKKMKHET